MPGSVTDVQPAYSRPRVVLAALGRVRGAAPWVLYLGPPVFAVFIEIVTPRNTTGKIITLFDHETALHEHIFTTVDNELIVLEERITYHGIVDGTALFSIQDVQRIGSINLLQLGPRPLASYWRDPNWRAVANHLIELYEAPPRRVRW